MTTQQSHQNNNLFVGVKRKLKIPWKAVLLSKPVWALILGQVGHLYVFFSVITFLPKYFREVLHFNVKKTGLLMAAPFIALWFCGWISGLLADYLINTGKASVLLIRNVFTFISEYNCSFIINNPGLTVSCCVHLKNKTMAVIKIRTIAYNGSKNVTGQYIYGNTPVTIYHVRP